MESSIANANNRDNFRLSFYASILYMFFEYMRLQEKYSLFKDLPLGKISAIIFLVVFFLEGRGFFYSNRINKYILAFSFWMVLASLFGINLSVSFDKITDIFKIFLIYFLIINTISARKELYIFIMVILVLYFSYTNFSFRAWASQGFFSGSHGTFIGSGYLNNANDFGAFLCAFWGISLVMISVDKNKLFGLINMKLLHLGNTLLFILAILITSARSATLGLAAGALYGISKSRKKITLFAVLFVVSIIYITLISPEQLDRFKNMGSEEDITAQERIDNWKAAIEIFKNRPLTGVGIGNYVEANNTIYNNNIQYVQHNIYLQALTETGLLGLILLLLIIGAFFKNQREILKHINESDEPDPFFRNLAIGLNISMISFLVTGFFITVLFYPFLWINLAISVSMKKVLEGELSNDY
jgi:putative inorganic carbon (hco3(-)) transporter